MACNDCPELNPNPNEGCLQPINSSCVTYDGNDIDCAEIASGQTISQVIETLANNDCNLQEQIDDLKDDLQELSGVVQVIDNKIEELSGSQYVFDCSELSACSIDSLSDVDVSPVSGDSLIFNGEKWVNYTPEEVIPYLFNCSELSGCELDDLGNVGETNSVSGDVLIYNGNNWVNAPIDIFTEPLQEQIDVLSVKIDNLENSISIIMTQLETCCSPVELDVEFSGSTIDICFQDSSPGKLFGTLHLVGAGTDFNGFDGTTMATIYISDSSNPSNTTKTVGYVPKLNGINPSYDIQLLSGMKDPIDTPVGSNTRTITFTVRFKDTLNNIHFVNIQSNIPQILNNGCSNGTSTTFTLDEF